jgi:hypothetical protein
MKRLVDRNDPDDEVVRLLIRSGADHHPAPGSKMRLMAALGVGSAVGLSASKVLAWLGTSSGKAALAMSVVGAAAGGAYVMASSPATPSAAAPAAATFEQTTARTAEPPAAEPILEPSRFPNRARLGACPPSHTSSQRRSVQHHRAEVCRRPSQHPPRAKLDQAGRASATRRPGSTSCEWPPRARIVPLSSGCWSSMPNASPRANSVRK